MIGALTMLVLEKQKDISVLHALGGNRNFIQKIFLSEGLLLAVIGGGIGMLLAILIAWLQINFHLIPLQGGSFLIDYFPVHLRVIDFPACRSYGFCYCSYRFMAAVQKSSSAGIFFEKRINNQ
jgi:lipoprotein-releasing system permease protein